jgi:myosin-1
MLRKLDEECIRPGEATAVTLLEKFNECYGTHKHYESRATNKKDKTLGDLSFKLKHYAGDVTYDVDAFLDKNKDLLFKDVIFALGSSKNFVIAELFPEAAEKDKIDLKRPPSAGYQFKVI